jgi:hypothetical protein
MDDLINLLKSERVTRFAYADDLTRKDNRAREAIEVWQTWWRDVLLAASHSQAEPINIDRAAEIQSISKQIELDRARLAVEACARATWQIDHNVTARQAIEVLLLDFPILHGN